jgi:DNA-binding CsgD family transcriptional regulator
MRAVRRAGAIGKAIAVISAAGTALTVLLGASEVMAARLTPRELECLRWTMEGKTAWEVGTILSISERTAVLHLNNAHRLSFKQRPDPTAVAMPQPDVAEFDTVNAPLGKISKDAFRPRGDDERELTLPELIGQRLTPPHGSSVAAMTAEIHKRIIDAASLLVLPFLALPFAVSGRRQQRAFRFGFALVLVIAVHEIIGQGSNAAHAGASPWITMWLPLGLLAAFAAWSYYITCFTVLRRRLSRKLGWGEP